LLISGCGGSKAAGGDPGGRRLKELAADAVFAAKPQGATTFHVAQTPAKYAKPGFTGGGWHGPSVVVSFTSTTPTADVYRFYAQQAQAASWQPTASGSLGMTDRWAKTYADGATATLILSLLTRAPSASERRYELAGGISLPAD
jgi:hypothetical protein